MMFNHVSPACRSVSCRRVLYGHQSGQGLASFVVRQDVAGRKMRKSKHKMLGKTMIWHYHHHHHHHHHRRQRVSNKPIFGLALDWRCLLPNIKQSHFTLINNNTSHHLFCRDWTQLCLLATVLQSNKTTLHSLRSWDNGLTWLDPDHATCLNCLHMIPQNLWISLPLFLALRRQDAKILAFNVWCSTLGDFIQAFNLRYPGSHTIRVKNADSPDVLQASADTVCLPCGHLLVSRLCQFVMFRLCAGKCVGTSVHSVRMCDRSCWDMTTHHKAFTQGSSTVASASHKVLATVM